LQKDNGGIFFREGSAENIPYESNSFEKLFSIEAAQHFESLEQFFKESYRVLKPRGKLAIASFFGTSDQSEEYLSEMIQTVRSGIDKITPIYKVEELLRKGSFKDIKIESIGKNVWHGYDLWIAQSDLGNGWGRNWYKGYQKGFVDYYLITAEK
jgi:cyclopropane fatty-acyl-phospholipid synthase-like methyltransferase